MASRRISRAAFIRLFALTGIGAGLAVLNKVSQPLGPVKFMRWKVRGMYEQSLASPAVVALASCSDYRADLKSYLSTLWSQAEMPDVGGKKVFIKPNLVDFVEGYPSTTSPEVVGAAVDLLKDMGAASIVVGDGPAFRREAQTVARQTGMLEVINQRGVRFIDLNYNNPQPVTARDGWFSGQATIWLPEQVLEADLILSIPKMKTHHWGGVSLSMKNLLGILPGCRYGWPKNFLHFNGLTSSIIGMYKILPPVVAIVDGIVGMEGDGPMFGNPVSHGLLAAGKDIVAVDVLSSKLMGYQLAEIDHLFMASWAGVGQATRIEPRGAAVGPLMKKYQKPPSM